MKYFLPDCLDVIDPLFDFETETHSPFRVRQQDELYAHEVFKAPPYDGILVSKAVVDGVSGNTRQYTTARRHRLFRAKAREFFRLECSGGLRIETMGDCGAFSYVRESRPPFSVQEVSEFYNECDFDYGISVDHVIPFFRPGSNANDLLPREVPEEWRRRQQLTLSLAEEFIKLNTRISRFVPIGVAQGWDAKSYAFAVEQLQRMGYRMIALGGMAPHSSKDVIETLIQLQSVRHLETQFHLLGLLRFRHAGQYRCLGVTSFDTTTPVKKSFKGDDQNYWAGSRTYTAIRVPQVSGNKKLQRKIMAGIVLHDRAVELERHCLRALRLYDAEKARLEDVLSLLHEFELLHSGDDKRMPAYQEVLSDLPWKKCGCTVCQEIGIHVVIFRGKERNTRRAFHNIFVFSRQLQDELTK